MLEGALVEICVIPGHGVCALFSGRSMIFVATMVTALLREPVADTAILGS